MLDVVTGGAGFIGSHLVDHLLTITDHDVLVIDNFSRGTLSNLAQHNTDNEKLKVVHADIRDRSQISSLIVSGVDRVFHLAALADIVPSIGEPALYYDTNVTGTINVLEAARAAGVSRFVYAASSSCYGIPDAYPTDEDADTYPQYPYAMTKLIGEELALHWAEVYGLPVVSARLFNVYGTRSATKGAYGAVWGVFMAQMMAEAPLTVIGNGDQSRDFIYVADAVSALATLADSDRYGFFNVGSGVPVSINHLIELMGYEKRVNLPARPGEPEMTWADIGRLSELGWAPKITFPEGVRIMLEHKEDWRNAPIWSSAGVIAATAEWMECLS